MTRRPLLAGGVVAISVGALLLSLGLSRGREGAPSLASEPATVTSTAPTTSPSSTASTPTASATPSRTFTPTPTSTPSLTLTPKSSPTPKPARTAPQPTKPTKSSRPKVSQPSVTSGLRLRVPDIGLNTSMRSGGVSSSGKINPPAGTAMWVRGYGRVQPGRVGTAVVAGHVVASGNDDVFARLSSVRVGDKVVVTSGSVTRTYVVRRAAVVKKSALTRDADVWGQNSSRRRIVLITCDDELGYRSDGHRVANYVVVADAV
ncbi:MULTISPECIES: class F sortase [unclassified Knoellia]|uniref:class F sortase n=1 Tax=Knoellia altitudinis TaxID=3404795 RepID=UPI003616A530